jgi:Fe-S cluster assembly protein SufD
MNGLRASCSAALPSLRMPTSRNEEFRYTDLSALTKSTLAPPAAGAAVDAALLQQLALEEAAGSRIVMVDGAYRADLSDTSGLPDGVYVGSVGGAGGAAAEQLGSLSNAAGGPFAVLNGAMAADALAVVVPTGTTVQAPIHMVYLSTSSSSSGDGPDAPRQAAAPRLLLAAGADSHCYIVEEFVGGSGGGFTCAVAELVLGADASVKHGYVEREAGPSVHIKATLVQQVGSVRWCRCGGYNSSAVLTRQAGLAVQGSSCGARDPCPSPGTTHPAPARHTIAG